MSSIRAERFELELNRETTALMITDSANTRAFPACDSYTATVFPATGMA
jgi:hypothetical protein